jgi:hypothetical protein
MRAARTCISGGALSIESGGRMATQEKMLRLTRLGVGSRVELVCEHGICSCLWTFWAFAVFDRSPPEGTHHERANRECLDAANSASETYARRHTSRTRTARNASMERKVIEPKTAGISQGDRRATESEF